MDIDIRTLYVVHALVSRALAVMLAVFWRSHRSIPGVGWWAVGSALLGFGLGTGALRGMIPNLVSIVLGNLAANFNIFCFWNGIRQFDGRPTRWIGPIAATLAAEAFIVHHTYVVDDVLGRIVVVSVLLAAGCALCAYELVRGPARTLRSTALTAATLYGLLAVTLTARALTTAFVPTAPSLFARGPVQTVHFLTSVVASLLVGVALLMMAAQRLQRRNEARAVDLEVALATAETRARELDQSRQQLAVAQRLEAMGQLTGGVAHDFNNLLTVVAGSVEMIMRGPVEATRVGKLCEAAMRAVGRGQQLTQSLLTFARRDFVRPEVVQPDRQVIEVEPLLRRATGERIELTLDIAPALHPVRIDPSRFEVALLNLVLNARDAMPGGGRISIAVSNADLDDEHVRRHPDAQPGPHVAITVADDGTGMPPEVAAQAFEPFFSTKDVGKGSGLGLSQVYGFMRGAGGHVTIDSRVGAGTAVRLYLPRTDQAPRAVEAAAPISAPRAARGDETVLIVEDDLFVLAGAVELIGELGYRTLTATNAHEALGHLRGSARIDLLFSDVILPGGIDGAQLALEAQRLRPGLKALLTTGYAGDALAAVPDDLAIMDKPYRRAALAAKLRELLGENAPAAPTAGSFEADAAGK